MGQIAYLLLLFVSRLGEWCHGELICETTQSDETYLTYLNL